MSDRCTCGWPVYPCKASKDQARPDCRFHADFDPLQRKREFADAVRGNLGLFLRDPTPTVPDAPDSSQRLADARQTGDQ